MCARHQKKFLESRIFSSRLSLVNVFSSSGLVKISTNYSLVLISQQNFGMVKNAKVNLYEGAEGNHILAKYDLEEDASMDRALRCV